MHLTAVAYSSTDKSKLTNDNKETSAIPTFGRLQSQTKQQINIIQVERIGPSYEYPYGYLQT